MQAPVQSAPAVQSAPPPGPPLIAADEPRSDASQGVRELPGVDVSHWQGRIDWRATANDGIGVAYLKASESTGYVDPTYERNRDEATAAGILVGAYHFARPGRDGGSVEADARAEAAHFLETAAPRPGELVPALDLEAAGSLAPEELGRWTRTFLDTVSEGIGGRAPVIYTSPSFWDGRVSDDSGVAREHPLWVAHWGVDRPDLPGAWDAWHGWQQTSSGSVDGIQGRVDRNLFRVDGTLTARDVGQG